MTASVKVIFMFFPIVVGKRVISLERYDQWVAFPRILENGKIILSCISCHLVHRQVSLIKSAKIFKNDFFNTNVSWALLYSNL